MSGMRNSPPSSTVVSHTAESLRQGIADNRDNAGSTTGNHREGKRSFNTKYETRKVGLTLTYRFHKIKERDEYLATLPPNTKYEIGRMKGLGEMNPEELRETTMGIDKRILKQVTLDDAILADETFQLLMGEEVEPRRKFIEDNALFVENLDI